MQYFSPFIATEKYNKKLKEGRKMNKLKVVIADNNPVLLQQLAEKVSCDNQLELVGAVDNGKDAYHLIEREKPNAVVFDLLLSYYDGFALMDKIKQQEGYDEETKLIMTTPLTSDMVISESYRKGVDYIIVKPYDIETISEKIKGVCSLSKTKDYAQGFTRSVDVLIANKLNQIGVPASLKGYRYMITAIKEVLEDETALEGVTKVLYPGVAKKHNSTPQRVEKAIRHAIEVAWSRNNGSKLKEEFEYSINSGKTRPTNSEFIAVLSQKIKMSA